MKQRQRRAEQDMDRIEAIRDNLDQAKRFDLVEQIRRENDLQKRMMNRKDLEKLIKIKAK